MRTTYSLLAILVAATAACSASAQTFRRAGTEFNAVRTVTVPAGKPYTIVVTEFMHHGEIHADGRNLLVVARNKEQAPTRVLQLGPGDFCRLAFQTIPGQNEYEIYYGGNPPSEGPPEWTCRDGLLIETRRFRPCNLNDAKSVRQAFDKAEPIGADYVEAVCQAGNPLTLVRGSFLSRYTGRMEIRAAGSYGFFTSSQDCSFLSIDGKVVVAAPGRHGPLYRAFRGTRHDIQLAAGPHEFEYLHAAAGPNAMMVAAWEVDPKYPKPLNPTLIPGEVFRTNLVGRFPAGRLTRRTARQSPDFTAEIVNDVPLPDNAVPLVGVLFREAASRTPSPPGTKLHWDFGDGQTSESAYADHVYLRPGLYAVTLAVRRGGRTSEITHRVYVGRPWSTPREKQYTFDEYLKIIESYNPAKLDAASLRQLVLAFEAKAAALDEQPEEARAKSGDSSRRYLAKAVAAGKTAFVGESPATGDAHLLSLARLLGPMARDQMGDSESAYAIWRGAAERVPTATAKAACQIAAADIAVNDLLKPGEAKVLLDTASRQIGAAPNGPMGAEFLRVRGDYLAATGDAAAARAAYIEAETLAGARKSFIEKTAWRGAHGRSTEEFLREKSFERAAEEIHAWQCEFPAERLDGYLTLLLARYWAGRGEYAQAIAQAEQLRTVSPDAAYVDQALLLAAECAERLGRTDRALATLHALVKDYPGSPLAATARERITALERAEKVEAGGKK